MTLKTKRKHAPNTKHDKTQHKNNNNTTNKYNSYIQYQQRVFSPRVVAYHLQYMMKEVRVSGR